MDQETFYKCINELTDDFEFKQIEIFRWLHQHPELAFQEFQSGQYISDYLRTLNGVEVIYPIAKTGVKAVLNGEKPGPAVAIRADFDALPVKEGIGLSYASKSKGTYNGQDTYVAHVCGHDASAASALGTANVLSQLRNELNGKIVFLFQPAEEGAPQGREGGAELMVKEGALKNPEVKAVFALHPYSKAYPGSVLLGKRNDSCQFKRLNYQDQGGSGTWVHAMGW